MTSFLRALFLLSGAAAASIGCTRAEGPSNGETNALEFTVAGTSANDSTMLATGFAIDIDVTRYDSYWQCPDLSKSIPPETSTAGTSTASTRVQSCGADPEPVSLIDARCDDDACTVTPQNDDGSGIVKLVVTGLRDGAATLHVDVKSKTSSATWGDSFAMQFSTATRIAIERQGSDTGSTKYASMPGASFLWCPELHDANETRLVVPIAAIATTVSGDDNVTFDDPSTGYVPAGCSSFHASAPGSSSIVFTAQSLTASGTVKVADPNDIVGAALYEISDTGSTASMEIGQDPHLASSPVTAISLSLDDEVYGLELASVLHMKDGSLALGGAGRYQASSDETLWVRGEGTDPEIAQQYMNVSPAGGVIGDGTVDATFGAVKVSIPFHIAGSASDAGTR